MKQLRITIHQVPPGLEAPEPMPVPRALATTEVVGVGEWKSKIGNFAYIEGEFYAIDAIYEMKKPRHNQQE